MVVVRLVDGSAHDIRISRTGTILDVAVALSGDLSVDPDSLRFVYGGRVLPMTTRISSLNLQQNFLVCNVLQPQVKAPELSAPPVDDHPPDFTEKEITLLKQLVTRHISEKEVIETYLACNRDLECTKNCLRN
jgi:hypothetical protein